MTAPRDTLERRDPHDCEICGSRRGFQAFRAKGLAADDPHFRVMRCPECGYGWTDPAPPDSEIGRWYPKEYYGRENVRFNPLFERMTRWFRRRRAREVSSRIPARGRVLDVGCGRGLILGTLKEWGFETHGVELSEESAWHAKHRMGAAMHVGNFVDAKLEPGTFDAIIFWHSLEHFRKPVAALLHAHQLLKPGGLLVVAVPNSDSMQARAFRADWFHLDVPRHYVHFGERALTSLLERAGFEIETATHFCFEQNPYGWLQSFYNAMELEWNLLYTILKNSSARMTPVRKHPWQAALTVALLPVFLPLAFLLTLVEAAFREGGTIEVYAFKE
ncbi:MAG: class I SAM-dependent methyltransferase [Elusimicrobia bacterium]|nr:class I SAM-dependent methyltransferase [Elusimicrobiota bacterium]